MTQPALKQDWHAMPVEETLRELDTTREGLDAAESRIRLEHYGPNALAEPVRLSGLARFMNQFRSPLIYVLLIASAIAYALGETIDGSVILVIVIFNAIIGFVQEHKAERALEALKQLAAPTAKVRRPGIEEEIPSEAVVPGDLIVLDAGDRVPADARVTEAARLKVDEALLTGESVAVGKRPEPVPEDTSLADKTNMLFSGTTIVSGRGLAVVTATGTSTVTGQIARDVEETPSVDTPIQRKLGDIGRMLGIVGLGIAVILVLIGVLRGFDTQTLFFTAVAVAVAFIPEGLPAIVTIVLAVGVQRMARRHAIIRKLPAVEALGAATVICTDKTGTLTRNEMTVKELCTTEAFFRIEGEGYSPIGDILADEHQTDPDEHPSLKLLLTVAALCNNARLMEQDGRWSIAGDPTEGALVVAAQKAGLRKSELDNSLPRVDELPFEPETRYMATLHRRDAQPSLLCVKGAPEQILTMCTHIFDDGRARPVSQEQLSLLLESNKSMADKAYRVLAIAYKDVDPEKTEIQPGDLETGLVFLGLTGMIDPPRQEAIESVAQAKQAGIRVIMITGDNPSTARAIADTVGILNSGETVTGRELEGITDEELKARIEHISVIARAEPQHKYRIVGALKEIGEMVAMTGDGVNDAPALKRADIGVSMGITGTDVARESSDMVLTDDNFATIVGAIEEGRTIFANLRKVVQYLLATNTGEILTFIVAISVGLPLPLVPVQILWVNLVTDGFATAPLSVEPKEGDVLSEPPRNPREPVITRRAIWRIIMVAVIMTIGTLGAFMYELSVTGDIVRARTLAFATLAIFQLFNVFNARSPVKSIFRIGFFTNPWVLLGVGVSFGLQIMVTHVPALQVFFQTTALTIGEWAIIILVTSTILIAEEIRKAVAPYLFYDPPTGKVSQP